MNEGDPKNREHWIQIFTTTPEILSTDHSPKQTTDKRIVSKKNQTPELFIIRLQNLLSEFKFSLQTEQFETINSIRNRKIILGVP
jgi:hypothetical protein